MRVAYSFEPCWHPVPGGTAVMAVETARALVELGGVELVGVAARHHRPPASELTPPTGVHQLPLPRPAMYAAWVAGRWAVERWTGTVDVVHATTVVAPPRSAPLVVTVHDLAFLDEPDHFTAWGVRLMTAAWRRVRDSADLVLCPSEATRRACEAAGVEPSRLRVVPNGVRVVPASDEDVVAVRARLGLRGPYLLSVGTLEPRKNLTRLAEALALVPDAPPLVVVGPRGWGDAPAAVDALARAGRLRALGRVAAGDLRALYAGAAVFVYPSLAEGFGLPVLEAMAQGTPVVTSLGTATEELAAGVGVLVDPRDVEGIARGIVEALSLDGSPGRARAAAYSWRRSAELTVAAYHEVTR